MEKVKKKVNNCVCAVAICPSPKSSSTSYHRFPRDPVVRQKWLLACRRDDRIFNPQTGFVCSNHFEVTEFERDLQNELLGLPLRKRLKPGAIPTLKLRSLEDKKLSVALQNRQRLKEKLQRKEIVNLLLKNAKGSSENLLVHIFSNILLYFIANLNALVNVR